MKTTMHNGFRMFKVALLVSLALVAGCAQQVGEIDRTQANYIAKKDLEGEWYFQRTTSDAPYAATFTFVGDQGKLERGTFEIQEGALNFYRTYEFSQFSQSIGLKADTDVPYLAWLAEDSKQYTPNPYQARGMKFAEGNVMPGKDGKNVACAGQKAEGGTMHEFCQAQTGSGMAYCGHEASVAAADRTHANAVCVRPTRYIFKGSPLAVYPIADHFDLKYDYNPGTGEPTNVLEENGSDRYWYEREFMRVNWSESQVVNFEFSLSSIIKAQMEDLMVTQDIVISSFEGEAAPEEEQFRIFRNEAEVPTYFDYVSRHILSAPKAFYEYWGQDIPICVFYPFYLGGVFECNSEEIKVRTAFMKVNPDDDYAPVQYDDHVMDKFGYFRQERQFYDEQYETTYTGVIRHIQRWDIWDKHPVKADGTPDYSQANPVPIVYYLSEDFPRDLVPAANQLAKDWARPFNQVVEFYKGKEAVPAEGMFILCENNNTTAQAALAAGQAVAQFESDYCKDMDYVKMVGDIRYSYLFSVVPPASNGLLGYGPSSADPLTGKILSANAYVYDAGVNLQANRAADLVELMAGYVDPASFAMGIDISQKNTPALIAVGHNPAPSSIAEAKAMVAGMVEPSAHDWLTNFGIQKTEQDWAFMRMSMLKQNPELDKAMIFDAVRILMRDPAALVSAELNDKDYERMALRNWANNRGVEKERHLIQSHSEGGCLYHDEFTDAAIIGLAKEWVDRFDQQLCSAAFDGIRNGEELAFNLADFNVVKDACTKEQEGQIRTEEEAPKLYLWREYNPKFPAAGDTCTFVSQGGVEGYYWVNTCTAAKLAQQVSHKIQYTELRNQLEHWMPSAWFSDTKDPLVAKTQLFVRDIEQKIRTEMVQEFRERIYLSVATHEIGHTLGLRHNFEASTDAMNFPQEYWEHKVALAADGKSWLPVDLFNGETDLQKSNSMRMLQYSSIMDYGAKFNDLWHGIGLYDEAAIKFGYGKLVSVFKEKPELKTWEPYLENPEGTDTQVAVLDEPNRLEELFKRIHYTQIPNVLGGPTKVYERQDVEFASLVGKKCASDADCGADAGCAGCTECRTQLGASYCSPPDKVEVPFRFCSDEYIGRTPYCDVWDQGVDPYEIVRNTVDDYWWYWPVWGYWRSRLTYYPDQYSRRILWAFSRMKHQFQWWAVNYIRFNQNGYWEKKFGTPWELDMNGGLSGAVAAQESFNTLVNTFAIPAGDGVGGYNYPFGYNPLTDRYEKDTAFATGLTKTFVLEEDYGKFAARPMYGGIMLNADEVAYTSGGAIYDRLNAFMTLCDPTTNFLAIDESPDVRKYLISYFTFFPDRMINLLGGITTQREANYAACVVEDANGNPSYLRLRDLSNMNDPGFCKDGKYLYPEEVDYSFPTTWFRIPMLAAYFGMSLMINDYDRRFMDTTRIYLKGHEDAVDLPADAVKAEFTDPMTGKTYVAFKLGDENTFDTAYYLVNKANEVLNSFETLEDLQADYKTGAGKLQKYASLLELIRGLHKIYDYSSVSGLVVSTSVEEQ